MWRGAAQRNAAKGAGRTTYRPPATGAERAQSLLTSTANTRCPAASGAPARQSHRVLPHGIHPCATPAIAPLRYPRPRIAPHGRRTCENNSVCAPKRRSGAAALQRCSACRGRHRHGSHRRGSHRHRPADGSDSDRVATAAEATATWATVMVATATSTWAAPLALARIQGSRHLASCSSAVHRVITA